MTETHEQSPQLVTRAEAAEILGVTPRTVTRYQKSRRITTYRDYRGRVRFDEAELKEKAKGWIEFSPED